MNSKAIAFILGLAVGAAACAALFNKKSQTTTPAAAAANDTSASNEIAELKSQLVSAKARLEKANAVNDKLAASVQESLKVKNDVLASANKPKKQSGFAALFGGDGTNGMSGMMKAVMEQQVEGKISAMKAKLNLTPDQEAAIRNILTNQLGRVSEMTQKLLKGELTKEEMAKMGKQPISENAQIKALLTPDQATAYDEYQAEEKANNARLMANSELLQMQSSLQLTADEQDKVFAVLTEQAQAQFDAKNTNSGQGFELIRNQAAKKAEALRAVLTADQFERYQKFQEQQLKMIKTFMPAASTNSNIEVPAVNVTVP